MKITRQHKKPLEFGEKNKLLVFGKRISSQNISMGLIHPSGGSLIIRFGICFINSIYHCHLSFTIMFGFQTFSFFIDFQILLDTDKNSSCFYIGYFSFESSTSQSLIILQLTTIISREQYLSCILCNGNESWSGQFRLIACICKCHQKCIYKLQHKQQKTRVFIFKGLCKRSKSVSYSVRRVMTFSM